MSETRLLWLLDQAMEQELTTAQVAVMSMLLALDSRDRAQISKAELGALVGLKERQVANVLKDLETKLSFIEKRRAGGNGKGRAANCYAINLVATSNPIPATHNQQQPIAGNAVPSASPVQQSNTGTEVLVACELKPEIPPYENKLYPPEIYPEPLESSGSGSAPKILNGSAKGMLAHDLARKLIEVTASPSLSARSHTLFKTCGEVRKWIDDGADFDADVVTTVAAMCERKCGESIQSFKYFTAAVRDAAKTRLTIEQQASNPITIEGTPNDRQRTGHSYASAGRRRARSVETEILMRDILDDSPVPVGRLDFSPGK